MKQYIYRCNYCDKELRIEKKEVYEGYVTDDNYDETPVYLCKECYKKNKDRDDFEVDGVILLWI